MSADTKWALKVLGCVAAKWLMIAIIVAAVVLAVWHCTPIDRLFR